MRPVAPGRAEVVAREGEPFVGEQLVDPLVGQRRPLELEEEHPRVDRGRPLLDALHERAELGIRRCRPRSAARRTSRPCRSARPAPPAPASARPGRPRPGRPRCRGRASMLAASASAASSAASTPSTPRPSTSGSRSHATSAAVRSVSVVVMSAERRAWRTWVAADAEPGATQPDAPVVRLVINGVGTARRRRCWQGRRTKTQWASASRTRTPRAPSPTGVTPRSDCPTHH